MALVDELVYPWPDPAAQELYRTLLALEPSPVSVKLLAQQTDIDTTWIYWEQGVALLWKEVLEHAARANRLSDLLERVLARLSPNHPARPFLQDLLDGRSPALSAEPRDANGRPDFLHADDEISEPEAMLFGDDLTMPIGQVPGLISAPVRPAGPGCCSASAATRSKVPDGGTGSRDGTNLRKQGAPSRSRRAGNRGRTSGTPRMNGGRACSSSIFKKSKNVSCSR